MKFVHLPHPRIIDRQKEAPAKVADGLPQHSTVARFNSALALWVTNHVGTVWCAYVFAVIGIAGVIGALSSNTGLVLIVGAVSGYFLQLVLLPVIIVGQNLQSAAADARSEATYKDAEAVLNECLELQRHMRVQDVELDKQTQLLNALLAARK